MNKILNDAGKYVIAVGAPGSLERIKIQYPTLIERLNSLYDQEAKIDVAINTIRKADIRSEMETNNLISASAYGDRPCPVQVLVTSIARDNLTLFCDTYRQALANCKEAFPSEYCWPVSALQAVSDRMVAAIKRGSFNKDSSAFRITCKRLNIPCTYKAINAFIKPS